MNRFVLRSPQHRLHTARVFRGWRLSSGRRLRYRWRVVLLLEVEPLTSVETFGFWKARLWRRILLSLLAAAVTSVAIAEEPKSIDEIEVIGVTPFGGEGLDRHKVPAHVQSATADQLAEQHALDLSQYMNRNFTGIFINEAQSNPLQNDIQFRGFVASPLLGLPQGLALYQDGVRINEVFGDTVNWALVPDRAIASLDLVAGSHPLFGLNSLGGALSIKTKNGFEHQGAAIEISGGSFDRLEIASEIGGIINDALAYYVNGSYFSENGWRDFSPSDARRFFGSIAWEDDTSNIFTTFTYADTDLIGNGSAPVQLLMSNRAAIFTHPDQTQNLLAMLSLGGDHALKDSASLAWNVYYRQSDINTLNGDDSDFEECEESVNLGFICLDTEEGEDEIVALDQNGIPIPANLATDSATVNRSRTDQNGYGASVQFTLNSEFSGTSSNQLLVGASASVGDVIFFASSELGFLSETRAAISSGLFLQDEFTQLKAETTSYSIYLMNTVTLNENFSVSVSGQYNRTNIELRDLLGTALNGDHDFDRFNLAFGITYRMLPYAQFYAGYAESSRTPSPVELTCADPNDPCRLPNAFLADPPLEQVVTSTVELGFRGELGAASWHFGYFNASNKNDIIFVSAGRTTNEGFFDNVGDTDRQGIELSFNGDIGNRGDWFFNYTHLHAEFGENFVVPSPNHPLADEGEIQVRAGDRLPGVPKNIAKAGVQYLIAPRLTIGGDVVYASDRVLRGDEGNMLPTIPSSTVFNLRGEFRVNDLMNVFFNLDNVFDDDFETFGVLGDSGGVLGDEFDDNRFLSPAAPRAAWIGIRIGTI